MSRLRVFATLQQNVMIMGVSKSVTVLQDSVFVAWSRPVLVDQLSARIAVTFKIPVTPPLGRPLLKPIANLMSNLAITVIYFF